MPRWPLAGEYAGLARRVARAQAVDLHQGLTRLAGAAENAIINSFERGRALLADLILGFIRDVGSTVLCATSSVLLPTSSGQGR